MATANTIPNRTEVLAEQTWDLSDLFRDFDAWDKDLATLPSEESVGREVAQRFRGRLGESPTTLHAGLVYRDKLLRQIERLTVYSHLRRDVDLANGAANERVARIESLGNGIITQFAFMEPEILAIKDLETWIKNEPLSEYAFPLSEILRNREHILSEKEEAVLARLSLALGKFSEVYRKWKNVDLQFPNAQDSKGNDHLVSNARYGQILQDNDRPLRQSAFKSYMGEHARWRNTVATNFFGHLQAGCTEAKLRGFSSFREQELFRDGIPLSVYDGLIDSVRRHLPVFHRSVSLRKRILGIDKVAHWDRVVSLATSETATFSWAEARDLVLASLEPMGTDYVQIARKGLTTNRWVDYVENQGKRSGAYSYGCHDSNPYILMSWTSSLRDVFTLAHELGHSMHSWYSRHSQPFHLSQYKIFVAEVASTFHEIMLANRILKTMPDSPIARSIVAERIQGFEGTVLRQCLFATFERDIAAMVDSGEAITPELIDDVYGKLTREWFGPDYQFDPLAAHEWLVVPHFYSTFYVYKYATSQCASEALSEAMLSNPKATSERMLTFMKAGACKPPLSIMLDAGINFLTPDPITNAFASYARLLDTAEQIFAKESDVL